MWNPLERVIFTALFAAWVAGWIDSHTISVVTTVDHTGATTTVVDLVCDEVITPETPTPTPAPAPPEVQND